MAFDTPASRLIAQGNQLESEGRLAEACALYCRAIAAEPQRAAAHLNLGAALEALRDTAGAERAYRAVLGFDPANAFAQYNLGNLAAARGDTAQAQALFEAALRARPDFPEARVALSNQLDAMGKPLEAARELRAALDARPDYAGAWSNYGLVLRRLERLDEAEDALRRALELDPAFVPAYLALGALLRRAGRIAEALQCYARARAAAPQAFDVESADLLTLLHSEAVSDEELLERHRAFAARLEALYPDARAPAAAPRTRLRVGYVSADFCLHPMAPAVLPVLVHHDRAQFEVHCYMTGTTIDHVTAQARSAVEHWHEAATLSDAALAAAIRGHGIDILVDLMGHSSTMRLGVFAQRPAPLQVSWLGYLHSTGMRSIRYRLCDGYTDPPGSSEHLHTEELVRLADSQWCYRPFFATDVGPAPCLANGFVTFGSFNPAGKLSPSVRRLWKKLLERLPGARLIVADASPGRATELLRRDLGAERVEFIPRLAYAEYFGLFQRVDIALDTWPYSGGTTTMDALWMGVPVVSAPSARSVSRGSVSLLRTVGLDDWIAPHIDRYVELAAAKAADPGALVTLRSALRARMQASPLMDEERFTRKLEDAYRRLWQRECDNHAP